MISVVYSTRKENKEFQNYIKKTIGLKNFEIHEIVNDGKKSLTECYNQGLDNTKNKIVVFCHDDIFLKDGWGKKIIRHFEKTDYGILGMAGTTDMGKTGCWWEDQSKMIGIVSHSHQGKTWENRYSENFGEEIIETVILDGLFFVVDRNKLIHHFDEDFKGFHFYDLSFCLPNYLDGVDLGVITNIRVTHMSIGETNDMWEENKKLFGLFIKFLLLFMIIQFSILNIR